HYSILIPIFYKVMVKYFPVIRPYTHCASSHTLTAFREVIFEPAYDIHIMDMLFYDVVTAQPVEIILVSHLIFHLILSVLTFSYPYSFTSPLRLRRSDVTDHTIMLSF